ncbi:hypothetical protein M3Y97_00977300 [Aphelenchoides bicaudatus]|nr:hypothetical protein M3Y97_00977300 [Aphelenchoides bicaudatus]
MVFAVAHGKKRGIFEQYSDCKDSTTGFPQPVFKKFDTKEEAEKFLKEHEIGSVSLDVEDKTLDKYYAVARGKVAGIFTDFDEVKKHFTGYPKPLYKKHSSYKQALAYFNKFNKGVEDSADDSGDEVKKPENEKAEKRGRNAEKDSVPSKKSKSK